MAAVLAGTAWLRASGVQGRGVSGSSVEQGLTRGHEGVSEQGVALPAFLFSLVPEILPPLAVRVRGGAWWLVRELTGGGMGAVALHGTVATTGVIALLVRGLDPEEGSLGGLLVRIVALGALQSTVYLGAVILVRARSTAPNLALVTLLLAGPSTLVAPLAPGLPTGQHAAGVHLWDPASLAGSAVVLLVTLGCLLVASRLILESPSRKKSHDSAHPGLGHQVLSRPHHR